jgi:hypothetical protein
VAFSVGFGKGKAALEVNGGLAVLVNTASMTRNGLLKPVKASATRDEPQQHRPNSSNEASLSPLWTQA